MTDITELTPEQNTLLIVANIKRGLINLQRQKQGLHMQIDQLQKGLAAPDVVAALGADLPAYQEKLDELSK